MRLRLAQTDHPGEFQLGIDKVRFNTAQVVPMPSTSWWMTAAPVGLLAAGRRPGAARGFA